MCELHGSLLRGIFRPNTVFKIFIVIISSVLFYVTVNAQYLLKLWMPGQYVHFPILLTSHRQFVLYRNTVINLSGYAQFAYSYSYIYAFALRTDTGGLASICVSLNYSGTTVARILYYTSYERYFLSIQ